MKELYIAPEWKIVCFAPAQKLANDDLSLDNGLGNGTVESDGDLPLDVT